MRERIDALVAVRAALEGQLRRLRSGARGPHGDLAVRRPPAPLPAAVHPQCGA